MSGPRSWFHLQAPPSIEPQRTKRDQVSQNYQIAFSTIQGMAVLDDLVQFAQNCENDSRGRGRSDVVSRILEMRRKATETHTEETSE